MKHALIISLITVFMVSCASKTENTHFHIVYKNDNQGNTLKGSKKDLIQFIRGGADLKIGWGVKGKRHSIEHLAEPIWIAVLDESEVIVHLDPQVLSKPDWNKLTADYADSTLLKKEWRVVVSTKGTFDAVWYNRKNDNVVERRPQNHTISWFVRGNSTVTPLFSNQKE